MLARRQPGSTLKPFVYELAFEKRLITPATLIDDSPAQIATGAGLYLPQNYDHAWKGFVSARTALGASLNVPAVRVGAMVGTDALARAPERARPGAAGKRRLVRRVARARQRRRHAARPDQRLPRARQRRPLRAGRAEAPARAGRPVRVADPAASFLVTDILADNNARVRTFGWASPLATRGFAAVKTGTSKDMRDNWCVGFTDRYTIGVWVGNASGEAMHDVSGVSGAAPVWQAIAGLPACRRAVARAAAAGRRGRAARRLRFAARAGARRGLPRRQRARRPARERARSRGAQRYGITSPRDGSIFAIDPDIPPAAQRITFEGERGSWRLDGRAARRRRAAALGAVARAASARAASALRARRCRASPSRCAAPASSRARRAPRSRGRAQRRSNSRSIAASMTSPHRL